LNTLPSMGWHSSQVCPSRAATSLSLVAHTLSENVLPSAPRAFPAGRTPTVNRST
jgi:hypothetical protein